MILDKKRLIAAREAKKLTKVELAEKANVSVMTIWRYEKGCDFQPRFATLTALSEALEIPYWELVK